MSQGDSNEFADIMDRLRKEFATSGELILPTPLGPITIAELTFLKGWEYSITPLGYPGTQPNLILGGPATTLVNFTDEKGWVLSFTAVFRSEYAQVNFTADSWIASYSPYIENIIGNNLPNNIKPFVSVYNPLTPLGAMYGISFKPAYAVPYKRSLNLTMNLPFGSPIAATTVFLASILRIHIVDERTFLRSIKKHMVEQMTGQSIERYP